MPVLEDAVGRAMGRSDPVEPLLIASEHRRFEAATRRSVRRAVRVAVMAILGATIINTAAMILLFPRSLVPAVLINGMEGLVALAIAGLDRGPARRWPEALAVVFAASAIVTVLHLLLFVPDLHSISLAYLILTPMAAALFLPWSTRMHGTWLAAVAVAVGAFSVSSLGHVLDSHEWADVAVVLPMSAAASLIGCVLLNRQRRHAFRQRLTVSRLHARGLVREAQIRRLNEELAEAARIDPLTGLWNRRQLNEELAVIADRWSRYGQTHAAVLVDIDRFKDYNDRFGHLAGDTALRRVAGVLKTHARASDTAYRYGGEEFLVLMPEQEAGEAARAAERLRLEVAALGIEHPGMRHSAVLTISAGVANLGEGGTDNVEDLLRRADAALYVAKRRGRNRVATHDDQLHGDHGRRRRRGQAAPRETPRRQAPDLPCERGGTTAGPGLVGEGGLEPPTGRV